MYSNRLTCQRLLHYPFQICAAVAGTREPGGPFKIIGLVSFDTRWRVVQSKDMGPCLRSRLREDNLSMWPSFVSELGTVCCSWFTDWVGTTSQSSLQFATEAFAITLLLRGSMTLRSLKRLFTGLRTYIKSFLLSSCDLFTLSSSKNLTPTITPTGLGFRPSHSFDTTAFIVLFASLAAGSFTITQIHHADPHSNSRPSSPGLSLSHHSCLSPRR